MILFEELLSELRFYQYKGVVLFKFNKDKKLNMGAEKLAEMVRALPGATRVSTASLDKERGVAILNVKLISQKTAVEAFRALKQNALDKFGQSILDVKVGAGSIEQKNFIK